MRSLQLLVLILGFLFATLSSAQIAYPPLPDGGRNNLVKVAKEQEELFVRRGSRLNDPEFQAIVDRVGETVFPQLHDEYIDYRIYLIRDPSPIIFSLADGQIYIHTGLLARLDDEAQLAAAIAHEAHHVASHDHIRANNSRRRNAALVGALAVTANQRSSPSDSLGGSWVSNMGHRVRTVFSEEVEFAADAGSVGLIAQAGHSPTAALKALNRMREDAELSTPSPLGEFTSRKSLLERHGQLQVIVDGLPVRSVSATNTYENRSIELQRVIHMTIDDYIRLDRPAIALEFTNSLIRVQASSALYAAKGDAYLAMGPRPSYEEEVTESWGIFKWQPNLTRDEVNAHYLETEQGRERLAENLENAAYAYEEALEFGQANARAYRGLGNLHYKKNEFRSAGRNYIKYLKLAPEALDRPTVLAQLQNIKTELLKQKELKQ
jgi:Zn-dependent protease with chaperone function